VIDVNVVKRLGDFKLEVSFRQPEPGVVALFGPSGAGKTSTINMIAGILRPDQGHVVVNGAALFDSSKKINLPPEKRRIGYVFQDGRLFPHLSVRSNLSYGMKLTPADQRYVAFDQVVEVLDLASLLARRPAKLSGGEKQRVAISRALLMSPCLLLMDEPLASLDSARKAEVLPFIGRIGSKFHVPIIYVSHLREEVAKLADTIFVIEHGVVTSSQQTIPKPE
jgi:molybdate transport system ATP-binding protein